MQFVRLGAMTVCFVIAGVCLVVGGLVGFAYWQCVGVVSDFRQDALAFCSSIYVKPTALYLIVTSGLGAFGVFLLRQWRSRRLGRA